MKSLKQLKEEAFNIDVTAYSDYISRPEEIFANIIAGAPTLAGIVPQLGAKANTTVQLNILTTDVVWSNADCVATGTGSETVLAPRDAKIKRITDREELCLDKLDAKLPMIQKAGADNTELPFQALYQNLKVSENAKLLEKAAFQGDATLTGSTYLNKVDKGWLKIAESETSDLGYYSTIVASAMTPSNIVATVQGAINQRTAEMYEMDDVKVFLNLQNFATLQQALLALYGAAATGVFLNTGDQNQTGHLRFMFPGTNVEVIGTHGMNNSIFITNYSNLRYLTDLESDMGSAEMFFDKYHRAFVSEIIYSISFQYEFPENVVYLKFV